MPFQFKTKYSDEEIVEVLRALSAGGVGRADAPDRLTPPNLNAFFNNLPTPERERLLDLVFPRPPKPAARPRRKPQAKAATAGPTTPGVAAPSADAGAAPAAAPVEIRPAAVRDLAAVLRIEQSTFTGGGLAYNAATLRQWLDVAQEGFLVAARGPAVVGYTIGVPSADRLTAWVICLVVDPAARRQGVGLALGHSLLERLRGCGARGAALTVHPDNAAARALYRQLGFGEQLVDKDYFGPGGERIVMRQEW